jgi:GNAT superfamily N-acetyltransferase
VSHPERLVHLQLPDLAAALLRLEAPLPAGIRIRFAELAADLSLIAELYNTVFEPDSPGKVSAGEVAHFAQHPGLNPGGVFLAFDDELAVGLGVGSLQVPAAAETIRQGAIELLAVRPGYRRRGIGRALIYQVLTWLAGQGVSTVGVSAEHPFLLTVLKRYGFRETAPAGGRSGSS